MNLKVPPTNIRITVFQADSGEKVYDSNQDIRVLIKQLETGGWHLQTSAALALAELGKKAAPAVPALIKALDSCFGVICGNAAVALGNIGKEATPAISKLTKLLNDNDDYVRSKARFALERINQANSGI